MISIDREIKITFEGQDAWLLTRLATFAIEVIQSKNANGHGWDEETLEELESFAHRFWDAIPNEGFL